MRSAGWRDSQTYELVSVTLRVSGRRAGQGWAQLLDQDGRDSSKGRAGGVKRRKRRKLEGELTALGGEEWKRKRQESGLWMSPSASLSQGTTRRDSFAGENEFSLGHWLSGALGTYSRAVGGHWSRLGGSARRWDQVLEVELPSVHLCLPQGACRVRAKTCSPKT